MMNRRDWMRFIAAGGAAAASMRIAQALAKGDLPRGINQLDGTATVNGRPAHVGEPVNLGDRVVTGRLSQAVIVVGSDAFLVRAKSAIEVKGEDGILKELVVASGQVLSVFSKKPVVIQATSASIGIRGTGAYIEINPDSVYFCLCYGEALVEGPGMAAARVVKTTHHEEPLILHDDGGIMRVEPGPFLNHTDAELVMLEALVGREPPFMKGGMYPAKQY
jgi:hypothetical protein